MSGKVLLVDDDAHMIRLIDLALRGAGIGTAEASTCEEALHRIDEETPAAVVLDLGLPDMHGKDFLQVLKREQPGLPVVIVSAENRLAEAVECMKLGATDYIQKPFDPVRLVTSVRNACEQGQLKTRVAALADELRREDGFRSILGQSPAVKRAVELLGRAAESDVTVLLEGESGTGKEIAARAIHAEGKRRTGPFVPVNCGAIPAGLVESELFGHEKGAFTGAVARRAGRFEQADGGTIFLDEVAELRTDLQVRLLRVLQERRITRVGASAERAVDVRVIAATNRDVKADVLHGRFRQDLFFRLAVFPVVLPPLRERAGDAVSLAESFAARAARRHDRRIAGLTPEARRAIETYRWPGNIRELENAIERATILEDGPAISLGSLPDEIVEAIAAGAPPPPAGAIRPAQPEAAGEIIPFDEAERRLIVRALEVTGWNVQEAASRLGLSRATIYRKIERYRLEARQAGPQT